MIRCRVVSGRDLLRKRRTNMTVVIFSQDSQVVAQMAPDVVTLNSISALDGVDVACIDDQLFRSVND